jgi:hypothetical protein
LTCQNTMHLLHWLRPANGARIYHAPT